MDKNAIKKYAVWARRELISRVSQRAALYEITADGYGDQNATSVHGRLMSAEEKKQRTALIAQIKEKGYEQVMEEIAYTWFNRFSALRFMEVNGYLPTRIRVFTNDDNAFKPQILDEAINMEMDGLDMQKVYDLKNANDDDALFKYMIITQCNALSSILPGMFQRISDYTELLFPDNLLREGSVVEQMIAMIPQGDWTDQVQIIGWLYQYYNTEPKDQVFANLKKNIKISKENIPAATQLFTPDWIVRYMVENSLGRLWLEGHPNDDLKAGWKYYLDEAEQEPEVQAQLAEIRKEYASLKPEDILAIDPCQGSGHILAYMFDVLVQIYEAYGYSAREAASSIVEHNIWGLDIDERAAQLAYFSVMMKARQYDRRFFSRGIQPHVYAIQESNNLDPHCIEYFVDGRKDLKSAMDLLVKELHDAKEYGSILNVTHVDFAAFYARFDEIRNEAIPSLYSYQAVEILFPFVQVAQAMAQKYHAAVTNPPYMGQSGMTAKMSDFIKEKFPASKADLFAVFIERVGQFTRTNGLSGMITQQGWMFLGGYEKLRRNLLSTRTIINMAHLGARAFDEIGGEVVQTTAFITRNNCSKKYVSRYIRLLDEKGEQQKEKAFFNEDNNYYASAIDIAVVTGEVIAYWLSENIIHMFQGLQMSDLSAACKGLDTGNNDKFLRFWFEVPRSHLRIKGNGTEKWVPYNKGGGYRKWYGLNQYVIDWEDDGYQLKYNSKANIRNESYYYKEGLTWSDLSTNLFGARYFGTGFIFDASGPSMFMEKSLLYGMLAFINSNVYQQILNIVCPGLHYNNGAIAKTPVPCREILEDKALQELARESVLLSKEDWDSSELSWDFMSNPLVRDTSTIEEAYKAWSQDCNSRFSQLKQCEEAQNEYFIKAFNLSTELDKTVSDKDVTVGRSDLKKEIKNFISYAVGCMFGRYSLDKPGIMCAGTDWIEDNYKSFRSDQDNIIPICDDEYFQDDIVGLFIKFVTAVYGEAKLEENLTFIAGALGGSGNSREIIRNYFLNDFYRDHCAMYSGSAGKRPIYWLFDSGKRNGFKCLIYMHRYQPDTIARIRTDYVHEQQSRYRTAIADLESRVANAGTGERVKLTKQLDSVRAQAEELRIYEEKIHHLADQMIRIDLDDGVKVNYAKFQDVLAKIK